MRKRNRVDALESGPRTHVPRRTFLLASGTAVAGVQAGQSRGVVAPRPRTRSGEDAAPRIDLSAVPNFCSHEHWGSIDALGMAPHLFRADAECGAMPRRDAGLHDILIDPYFNGHLSAAGDAPNALPRPAGVENFHAWAVQAPREALAALRPAMARQELTGTYQCIRRGLLALYGADIADESGLDLASLNGAIAKNYERMFAWYREAMRRCHFTELIRPVHPEYCVRDASPETAQEERAFTHTVLRIDPFLDLWPRECPRRTVLAEIAGVTPVDAATWRAFLAKTFEIAAQKGCVGIKQLQAYTRTLEFIPREDGDVVWTGALSPIEVRAFQDWVVHECCRLANERGWPHQIHVGTHNLAESSPLPLGALAARYPRMKIVMLHCWPFLKESGWLAKQHPNVYLDTCWQPILSPDIYQEAMREWLPYVPRHKIMCGHDATSIEMAAGSASFVRELLAEALAEQAQLSNLPLAHIERAAADILHNNAVAVYAIGKSL